MIDEANLDNQDYSHPNRIKKQDSPIKYDGHGTKRNVDLFGNDILLQRQLYVNFERQENKISEGERR